MADGAVPLGEIPPPSRTEQSHGRVDLFSQQTQDLRDPVLAGGGETVKRRAAVTISSVWESNAWASAPRPLPVLAAEGRLTVVWVFIDFPFLERLRRSAADVHSSLYELNIQRNRDFIAHQEPTGFQCHVPVQAEVFAVDLRGC